MDITQVGFKPTDTCVEAAAAANNPSVATLTGKSGYRWCVTGYTMSTDGNLAAKVTAAVISGAQTVDQFRAPAALPVDRVVEFSRPVMCPAGTDVVATLPAGGAGIVGDVVLRGFQVQDR